VKRSEGGTGTAVGTGIELALVVFMALAAVGTAWAGFQSAKWSGLQAIDYARAGAIRTESARASTRAGQLMNVDVTTFTQWVTALGDENREDPSKIANGHYRPNPHVASGFLFDRFRTEFKPAMTAWLATKPLLNAKAPRTPFEMPQYKLAANQRATRLLSDAERYAAWAGQANQRSDNYVLTVVLLALVLFFGSVTQRMTAPHSRTTMFVLTAVALVGAVVLLALYPVQL
jgi:hypothetical protein